MPRAPRVCPRSGCPTLTAGGYCQLHARELDRARGTTTERGYGHDYQQARAAALDGATHCVTCGEPFTEDNPATGGHVVDIRHGGTVAHGIVAQCRRDNLGWRRTQPT